MPSSIRIGVAISLSLFASVSLCASVAADDRAQKPAMPPPAQVIGQAVKDKALENPQVASAVAASLEETYRGTPLPESVKMLLQVLRGGGMAPGEGWFGPAETRYTWTWLAARHGIDPARGTIRRGQWQGTADDFAKLDRNQDGAITADDLDWSDGNPYVQASNLSLRLFRKLDRQANGQLTKQELLDFFEQASRGKDHLSSDDLREAVLAGLPTVRKSDPRRVPITVRGLLQGDIGSLEPGPRLNDRAPDFTLKSFDESREIQLSKLSGPRPIVLVFGSFT